MKKLLFFVLFSTSAFAVEFNHGYIGKPQFDINEARFNLFDEKGNCRYHFNDIHFHPRNFVMQGESLVEIYEKSQKNCIGKILLGSLPLLEHWADEGSQRPKYYTDDKSKFYWNTISDVPTFEEYRHLTAVQKEKFVFLLNGFLHFDLGAIEAVKNSLDLYPDLPIKGFGEIFGEHDIMSDQMNPPSHIDSKGLDKVYDLAAHKKYVVLIHNNLTHRSFKGPTAVIYRKTVEEVLHKHPNTRFIWAHAGIMRNIVVDNLTEVLDEMLQKYDNLYIDLSFVVLENYIMPQGEVRKEWVELIEKYPNRFLYGSDDLGGYGNFYDVKKYLPLLEALRPKTAWKFSEGNFEKLLGL